MIEQVKLTDFKCHSSLTVSLREANILVGPNNAGKSIIIDAFRVLSGCLSTLRTRNPTITKFPDGLTQFGYSVPRASIQISLNNAIYDYKRDFARIDLLWRGGNRVSIFIDDEQSVKVRVEAKGEIKTTTQYKAAFPGRFLVLPQLAPLEQSERYLSDATVSSDTSARLFSRHFRNYWLRRSSAEFDAFRELVATTWDGVSIEKPSAHGFGEARIVEMYYREDGITREISWSGVGLQIWLQLLTSLCLDSRADCIVVDEPDIYLHPDVQKKFLNILRNRSPQFIIATHSPEIISDAGLNEVASVKKGATRAKRVGGIEGLQNALESVGSSSNIELTKLSKAKRIVFFEGDDKRLLNSFARRLGLKHLAADASTLFLKLGGFARYTRIESVSWTFKEILGSELKIFSILDRDYRCREEVDEILARIRLSGAICEVWPRKEIENFLLDPTAIASAVAKKIQADERLIRELGAFVDKVFEEETGVLKYHVFGQAQEHRRRYLKRERKDTRPEASIDTETFAFLDAQWSGSKGRSSLVPGKDAFSQINRRLQEEFKRSVTQNEVVSAIATSDIDPEFQRILQGLDDFCKGELS